MPQVLRAFKGAVTAAALAAAALRERLATALAAMPGTLDLLASLRQLLESQAAASLAGLVPLVPVYGGITAAPPGAEAAAAKAAQLQLEVAALSQMLEARGARVRELEARERQLLSGEWACQGVWCSTVTSWGGWGYEAYSKTETHMYDSLLATRKPASV